MAGISQLFVPFCTVSTVSWLPRYIVIIVIGLSENAGRENDGPSKLQGMKLQDMKMQDMKMQDMKMTDQKWQREMAGEKSTSLWTRLILELAKWNQQPAQSRLHLPDKTLQQTPPQNRPWRMLEKTFAKQHQQSKEKLTVQRKSTSTNWCCYFTLQNETRS